MLQFSHRMSGKSFGNPDIHREALKKLCQISGALKRAAFILKVNRINTIFFFFFKKQELKYLHPGIVVWHMVDEILARR